jgi:hypothetical protein
VIAIVGIISSGKVAVAPVENEIIELEREKISAAFGPRFFLGSQVSGWVSDAGSLLVFVESWASLLKKSDSGAQPLKGRLISKDLRYR